MLVSSSVTTSIRSRLGQGAIVLIVACALLILGLMGASSYFLGSGTGRTYGRVVDTRLVLEAGDAAISEAVAYVRASMDRGAPVPPGCADDWRTLLLNAMATHSARPTGRKVLPIKSREVFRSQTPELSIGDVTVDVVGIYAGLPSFPPQGVLEMSVRVKGAQQILHVEHTIRERRVFYVTTTPKIGPPTGPASPSRPTFTLLTHPLGTVVE
jgi:hypothetical protein